MARIGKIARCPVAIREELNQRLRAGHLGPQLLPWLNSQPEVQAVLTEHFTGQPVNAQNLSDWRQGGFAEWEEKQDKTYRIKELAQFAAKLTEANGGRIAEGAAAIASGKILELLESFDTAQDGDEAASPLDQLGDVIAAVASLRAGDIAQQRTAIDQSKLKQKEEELRQGREKIELLKLKACEAMLSEAVRSRAAEIANSNLSNADKIAAMRAAAFADVDALEASGQVQLPK
jgi:hypothetical protein